MVLLTMGAGWTDVGTMIQGEQRLILMIDIAMMIMGITTVMMIMMVVVMKINLMIFGQ